MDDLPPLPPEAVYLPFGPGPHRLRMALTACPARDWIALDATYPAEMAQRRALLATRRAEVFAALPGSDAARAETLGALAAHLPAHFPGWFAREGTALRNRLTGEAWDLADPPDDPLAIAGQLVAEDLCLVDPAGPAPLLTAAMLCFPSRWRLAEKIGRPLAEVHEPVPGYAAALARPVDRFMAAIRPGHIALRLNWALVDDPALFQPAGKFRAAPDPSVTVANAGARLFLRVERQTLRLLPTSGAVLFGIRVHVYPLARIAAQPAPAARLAAAVRALPAETLRYKSVAPFRDALLAYLDRKATSDA